MQCCNDCMCITWGIFGFPFSLICCIPYFCYDD